MVRRRSKDIRERVKREEEINKVLSKAILVAQTPIYPCEDPVKVERALRSIGDGTIEYRDMGDFKILIMRSRGGDVIRRIFNHFRKRRVLATLRSYLLKYMENDEITIYLHKQAAYTGVLSLCEPGESPLGEIIVKIKVERAEEIIRYLTIF